MNHPLHLMCAQTSQDATTKMSPDWTGPTTGITLGLMYTHANCLVGPTVQNNQIVITMLIIMIIINRTFFSLSLKY